MFGFGRPKISFLCAAEDKGVIAEPFPAKSYLPGWFRKLPAVDRAVLGPSNNGQTIKRCMPFLDAMTTGWIMPLAATVRIEVAESGRDIRYGWEFDRTMVSEHLPWQIEGHPLAPRSPLKLHNYWSIRTPPGWSCLFTAPLNRAHPAIELLAGVVDTDSYHGFINLPFVMTGPDGLYEFEKGMPVAQVIPFRRDSAAIGAEIRAETPAESEQRTRILRSTQAGDGWYRLTARAKRG